MTGLHPGLTLEEEGAGWSWLVLTGKVLNPQAKAQTAFRASVP